MKQEDTEIYDGWELGTVYFACESSRKAHAQQFPVWMQPKTSLSRALNIDRREFGSFSEPSSRHVQMQVKL
jgi:hypothetical protein